MTSPRRSLDRGRSLDEALALALEDLEAGLGPLEALARYPEYEADLAPLLDTGFRLRSADWPVLSMSARVRGRERMHAARSQQEPRRSFVLPPLWRQLGAALVLVALAATTFMAWPGRRSDRTNVPGTATVEVAPTPSAAVQPTFTPAPTATEMMPPAIAPTREPGPEATETAESIRSIMRTATSTVRPTGTPTPSPTPTATSTPTPTASSTATPAETTAGAAGVPAPPQPTSDSDDSTAEPHESPTVVVTEPAPSPEPTHDPTVGPPPLPTFLPPLPTTFPTGEPTPAVKRTFIREHPGTPEAPIPAPPKPREKAESAKTPEAPHRSMR